MRQDVPRSMCLPGARVPSVAPPAPVAWHSAGQRGGVLSCLAPAVPCLLLSFCGWWRPACPAVGEKMRGLLVDMKKAHPGQDDALKTCWQTLLKMCGNVYNSPGGRGFHGGGGACSRRLRPPRAAVAAPSRAVPYRCAIMGKHWLGSAPHTAGGSRSWLLIPRRAACRPQARTSSVACG